MKYKAVFHVRPKLEVRDPQGEAISSGLRSLGIDVTSVRTGKEIVVAFDAVDFDAATAAVRTMGSELLANPVIEDFVVEWQEGVPA